MPCLLLSQVMSTQGASKRWSANVDTSSHHLHSTHHTACLRIHAGELSWWPHKVACQSCTEGIADAATAAAPAPNKPRPLMLEVLVHMACMSISLLHCKIKVNAAGFADEQLSTVNAELSAADIGSRKGSLPSSLLHVCTLGWQQMLRQGSQLHAEIAGLAQSIFGCL